MRYICRILGLAVLLWLSACGEATPPPVPTATATVISPTTSPSPTPTPEVTARQTVDFGTNRYVSMSAETVTAMNATFPGTLTGVQVYGDDNNPQLLRQTLLNDLQKQGWTVVPVGGQSYATEQGRSVMVLTLSGRDIALLLLPVAEIEAEIVRFSKADQAQARQAVKDTRTAVIVVAGVGFAVPLAQKLSQR